MKKIGEITKESCKRILADNYNNNSGKFDLSAVSADKFEEYLNECKNQGLKFSKFQESV